MQLYADWSFSTVGLMLRLDTRNNAWEMLRSMNQARYHAVVASVHGQILVFGGMYANSWSKQYYLSSVECFDPVSNTWHNVNPMPAPFERGSSVITVGGTRCYVIGKDVESRT